MREAVHQVVEHHDEVEIVADCGDGATLLAEVRRTRPDVVVTDVRMPPSGDDEGIRVAQRLRETAGRVCWTSASLRQARSRCPPSPLGHP